MKLLYVMLAGYALFSQADHAVCGGMAGNDGLPRCRDRPVVRGDPAVNRDQLKVCCQKIVKDVQRIYYLNSRNGKVKMVVRGIYTHGKEFFFALRLVNRSPLDYEVDSIRFFVAEKQKGFRSLRRLNELKPVFMYDSATLVKEHSRVTSVVVIPRLTLARHRRLLIEVLEKNGGRQLLVQAANFTLEMAKLI